MIYILPFSSYILHGDETWKQTDLLLPPFLGEIQSNTVPVPINTESKNSTSHSTKMQLSNTVTTRLLSKRILPKI